MRSRPTDASEPARSHAVRTVRARRHVGRRRTVTTWAAAVASAVVGLSILASGVVHADNTVVNSSPESGAVRDVSPDEIVITFSEQLGETNTIRLDCGSEQVALAAPEVGGDGLLLSVTLTEPLPRATCVINWEVTDVEGQPNGTGVIPFSVSNDTAAAPESAPADAAPGTGTTAAAAPVADDATAATDGDADGEIGGEDVVVTDLSIAGDGQAPLWLGRLLSTLAIATLFGSLVVISAAWPEGVEYLVTIRFIRAAWFVAVLATVLFVAAATAAATERSLGAGFGPIAWLDLVDAGWAGRAALVRLLLIVAAGWVAFRPDRAIDPATQIAGLGIPALATATTGISRTLGDLAAVGVVVNVVHVLAMAVWVGGVVLLARVVLAGPGEEDLVHAVRGFGRVSTVAIVVTVATGLVQLVRLDGGDLFDNGHGRVVLLKSVVVAAMIFVGISARQFVAQRLARAQEMSVPLASRLRRAFGAEAGIGVVTLALSAWLLALTPPNIDTTPRIPYDVRTVLTAEGTGLEVQVSFTDDVVGVRGIEIDVRGPEDGISNLDLVLTAPPNQLNLGTITQPVPLTGPGVAVRREEVGLPLTIPGRWGVKMTAAIDGVPVETGEQILNVLTEDGTEVTTDVTFPPVNIVTIPDSSTPPTDG